MAEKIGFLTISLQAQTIGLELGGAVDPDSRTYIGEAPAELEGLIRSTVDATGAVDSAQKAIPLGCQTPGSGERPGCYEALRTFWDAVDDLQSEFDAWSPYVG